MSTLIFLIAYPLWGNSINLHYIDLFRSPDKGDNYLITKLHSPEYVRDIIKKINALLEKNPDNRKLYRLRNIYTFIYWWVLPHEKKMEAVKMGLKFSLESVKRFPDDPDGWLWKGSFLGLYGLLKGVINTLHLAPEGISALMKSYKLNRKYLHCEPAIVLGKTLYKLPPFPVSYGDRHKAQNLLLEAVRTDPDFPFGYVDLAEFENDRGDYALALSYLSKISSINPHSLYAEIMLAWTKEVLPVMQSEIKEKKWSTLRDDFFLIPFEGVYK